MNVRCLFFIAPVLLLTADRLSSHLSQVRHLLLKILDLPLDTALAVSPCVKRIWRFWHCRAVLLPPTCARRVLRIEWYGCH